jgi:hypothetical protein
MWWSFLAILRSIFGPFHSAFKSVLNWVLNKTMSSNVAWDEATLPHEHPEWSLSKILKHPLVVGIISAVVGGVIALLIAA